MKKLLLIFSLFLPMITLSTNTISCFGRNKSTSSDDDTLINDETIPSAVSSSWYHILGNGNYIQLINDNQQLVVPLNSKAGSATSKLSNINLDFSDDWEVGDLSAPGDSNILENGNYYYISYLSNALWSREVTPPDTDGNCTVTNKDYTQISGNHTLIMKSNNKIFAFNSDSSNWDDITDPDSPLEVTISDIANQQYIWNSPDNTLYLGTSNGLWTYSEDVSWTFFGGTEALDITSITGTSNEIFLGTSDNGLWEYDISSNSLLQIKNTQNKKINPDSLFISNDNNSLFFGIENEGLWELPSLSINSSEQLIGKNELITSTTNIKSIKETKNNVFVFLTNTDIVTYN